MMPWGGNLQAENTTTFLPHASSPAEQGKYNIHPAKLPRRMYQGGIASQYFRQSLRSYVYVHIYLSAQVIKVTHKFLFLSPFF